MNQGSRFTRRLACAVATFEIVAGLGTGAVEPNSFWGVCFVIAAPFAIYGTLLPVASRAFESRMVRALGFAGLLVEATLYLYLHDFPVFSWSTVITLGAAAAAMTWLVIPEHRFDHALRWLLPACAVPAALALALWIRAESFPWLGTAPQAQPPPGAPNLVLVSWDTVRADVLNIYGGVGTETPHLDRFAAEGVVFEDAVALASITGPSHASMLTGRSPPVHGLRSNGGDGIEWNVPMLPEMLHAAGYRTAGFVSAYPLLGKFGFARGFEIYNDRLPSSGPLLVSVLGRRNMLWLFAAAALLPRSPEATLPGAELNARAAEWLESATAEPDTRPFFLFVHYYDAHGPFDPPEPWREQALTSAATAQPAAIDPTAAEEMALYRAEIAQVDEQFGELLAELEESDPGLQNTVILLTSDHGECFGEGGIVLNHTASLLEATQRVPMVLRLPGAAHGGSRMRATVTHLDLTPSFLAMAEVKPPPEFRGLGHDLRELDRLRPPGSQRRQVYMEAQQEHLGGDRKIAWRTGRRKLVQWQNGHEELWGFGKGEQEGVDLSAANASLVLQLRAQLVGFLENLDLSTGEYVDVNDADASSLDALGYSGD